MSGGGQSSTARDAACLETRRPRRQASKDCRFAAHATDATALDAVVPAWKAEPRRGGGAGRSRRRRRRGPRWARRCRRPKRCRPTASPPVSSVSSSSSWSPWRRNHRSRRFWRGTRPAACLPPATRGVDVAARPRVNLERRGFLEYCSAPPARRTACSVVFLHPKETHGTLLEPQAASGLLKGGICSGRVAHFRRAGVWAACWAMLRAAVVPDRPSVSSAASPSALAQGWARGRGTRPTKVNQTQLDPNAKCGG